MFASICNFWDFYSQNTISKHGIECIKILNEIICDFDQVSPEGILYRFCSLRGIYDVSLVYSQLLFKPKFSSVEKVKTIGSTYMAATGVQKGRGRKRVSF